jgi:hypothetical protein
MTLVAFTHLAVELGAFQRMGETKSSHACAARAITFA